MKSFILSVVILSFSVVSIADDSLDAKMKGYQNNLNHGIEAIVKSGAESQKENSDQLSKIQSFWNSFQDHKGDPVPAEDKYRNTTYDKPVIYK